MSDDPTKLRIGELVDPAAHARTGQPVLLDPASLTTHGVIVGMTGSGKTGLGVVLLEEALLQGIPAIIIDPKGDLGNLLLTFPDLTPEQFAPWVETPAGTAPVIDPVTDPATGPAASEAQRWREGLASWGLGPANVAALRAKAAFTIYTPGSTAGVPLNLIGSLDPPPGVVDDETRTDQIETIVTGLLQLVGIDSDPLSGREHILLANLLANVWQTATPIDLGGLIAQVQQPPMRRLGVIELDTFFPPADRNKLALAINGLLASPSFSSWSMGEALDPARLLTAPDGRPRAAIISISHLDDAERQFVVSLLLSRVIAWMRQQPGTSSLRALVYFDEVFGFVPPNGMPPAKKPILTLLKQARAFGLGMVLATQNPVDLDYKAIGNAGTWLIGRLQTEQDRARLIDGLSSAGGTTDPKAVDDLVAGLAKREFVLRQTGTSDLPLFTSRWSLSYLRGPVTREQIAALNASAGVGGPAAPAPPVVPIPPLPPVPPPPVAPTPAPATALAADETPIPPTMAPDVRVAYLDAAAPWATALVAVPNGLRLAPALIASVHLHFDERALGLDLDQTWEAVLFPLAQHVDVALAIAVDHDERDFRTEAPAGSRYVIPGAPLDKASFFKTVKADLVAELQRTRTVQVLRNQELALSSRPGETPEQFAQRCNEAAERHENEDAAKLRTTLERKIDRIKTSIDTAQDRVDAAEQKRDASRTDELLGGAGSLVSGFLGGRRSARGIASDVRSVASRHNRTKQAASRIEDSQARLEDKVDDLHELEQELADSLIELDEHWRAVAAAVETVEVPLDKGDVRVDQLFVAWVPVGP